METPEVHAPHAHPRRGLPQWLELTIALTALITSISSIFIAVHHGKIMEKLVQANSIPYLQGGFSTATPEGAQVLSLDLLNRGVGPAHERSLRVKVDGRYVRSVDDFILASLGRETFARARPTFDLLWNRVPTRFIPGGQSQMVFRLERDAQNAQYWDLLEKAQPRWDVEFCYCSVFDDCWEVRGKWAEPKPIEECRREEAHEFMP